MNNVISLSPSPFNGKLAQVLTSACAHNEIHRLAARILEEIEAAK